MTEAVATVHAALAAGINLIDTAPSYGACEAVIASALRWRCAGRRSHHDQVSARNRSVGSVATKLEESLDASLEAMRLDRVDVYFLHSNICEDDTVYAHGNEHRAAFATPWSQYVEEVVPAFAGPRAPRPHRRMGHHRRRRSLDHPQRARARGEAERRAGHDQPVGFARRHPEILRSRRARATSSPRPTRTVSG